MKKLQILYDYQAMAMQKYGGITRYFFEIISRISKTDGIKVTLPCVFYINHYFEKFFIWNSVSLSFYKKHSWVLQKINKAVTLFRSKNKYDIIHVTYNDPYIIGKFKGKLVTTIHDMTYELFADIMDDAEINIAMKKKYIYAADIIISVSECTKRDILKFYPDIPKNKIIVIYHGNSMIADFDRNYDLGLPRKYILYLGMRKSYKNFLNFTRAITPLLEKDRELHLVCGGGGAFTVDELMFLADQGIQDQVIQFGYDDDNLKWVYKNSLCFVYPSKYEGFGIPILEAWACQCPVVLSNASCFPEIAGEAAIYFDPENIEDMQSKVSELIQNDDLKKELIWRGRERLKLYSWEKAAEETLKLYKSLLNMRDLL